MMNMNRKKAELLMTSVSLAWGSSYLLMKIGLEGISPFNLIAMRFGIAFVGMSLIFLPRFRQITTNILKKGLLLGGLLFLIFTGLVFGVNHTEASTAGFLASTTVIIVPILESIIKRRLPEKSVALSILPVITGLYLLTMKDSFFLDRGAVYCMLAAFFYAIYILVLDRIAKQEDTLLISIIQLGAASGAAIICMMLFEKPSLPETPPQWGAMLALGLVCSAYGFVIQPVAQKHTSPERIGLIFSLEPVFSAVLSYIFLHEVLELKGYLGAALILSGVVLSKLPKRETGKRSSVYKRTDYQESYSYGNCEYIRRYENEN